MIKSHQAVVTLEKTSGERARSSAQVRVLLNRLKIQLDDGIGSQYRVKISYLQKPEKPDNPTVLELHLAENDDTRVGKIVIEATAEVVAAVFNDICYSLKYHNRDKEERPCRFNCPKEEQLLEWKTAIDNLSDSIPSITHADVFYAEVYFGVLSLNDTPDDHVKLAIRKWCGKIARKFYSLEGKDDDVPGTDLVSFTNRSDGRVRRYNRERKGNEQKSKKTKGATPHSNKLPLVLSANPADISLFDEKKEIDEDGEESEDEELHGEDEEMEEVDGNATEGITEQQEEEKCEEDLAPEAMDIDDSSSLETFVTCSDSPIDTLSQESVPSSTDFEEPIQSAGDDTEPLLRPKLALVIRARVSEEQNYSTNGSCRREDSMVPLREKIDEEHSYCTKPSPTPLADSPPPLLVPERLLSPPPLQELGSEDAGNEIAGEPIDSEDKPADVTSPMDLLKKKVVIKAPSKPVGEVPAAENPLMKVPSATARVKEEKPVTEPADWSVLLLNNVSRLLVVQCGAQKLKLRIDVILDNTFHMLVACKNRDKTADAVADVLNSEFRVLLQRKGILNWPFRGGFAPILMTMFRAYDACFALPAKLPKSCLACNNGNFASSKAVETHVKGNVHLNRIKCLDFDQNYMKERKNQFREFNFKHEKAYELADQLTYPTDTDATELIGKYEISMEKWLRAVVDVLTKRALSGTRRSTYQMSNEANEEEDNGSMPDIIGPFPSGQADDEEIEVVYESVDRRNAGGHRPRHIDKPVPEMVELDDD